MNIALRNGVALCSLTAEEINEVCSFSYDELFKVYNSKEDSISNERLRTAKNFGHEICRFCAKVFSVDRASNVNFMVRNINEKRIIVSLSEAVTAAGNDLLSEMDDISLKAVNVLDHVRSEANELEAKFKEAIKRIISDDLSTPCIRCFRFFSQDGFLDARMFSEKWLGDNEYRFTMRKTKSERNGVIFARIKYPSVSEARKAELVLAEFAEVSNVIMGETFSYKK